MFACYLGELVEQVVPDTEADPLAILVSLLVWPLVIGRSAARRKGASSSTARRLLTAADVEFMAANVRTGLTSIASPIPAPRPRGR